MSFKTWGGIILIAFALYLWFGEPDKANWPGLLGKTFMSGWKFIADVRPYSTILSFVLGIAMIMIVRKP
jgi:hypothetical protein